MNPKLSESVAFEAVPERVRQRAATEVSEVVQRLTDRLQREPALAVDDPGPKPSDGDTDQRHRWQALGRFHAALAAEKVVNDGAVAAASREAADAVWLGASLADLSVVTGKSRQAARKKWPELGAVHRRRKWLAHHVEEVHYAARQLVGATEALTPSRGQEAYDDAAEVLGEALSRSEAAFAENAPSGAVHAAARWRELDELLDRHVREVLDLATVAPTDQSAEFAAHGAKGVLTYYDMATDPSADPE